MDFGRQVAIILYADIDSWLESLGLGKKIAERTEAAVRKALNKVAADHGGHVEEETDDFLALFDSADAAFACGLDILALAKDENAWKEIPNAGFRMGIHIGSVLVDHGEAFGSGVEEAKGLAALADPGDLCISQPVAIQLSEDFRNRLIPIGRHLLMDFTDSVDAYEVVRSDQQPQMLEKIKAKKKSVKQPNRFWWISLGIVGFILLTTLALLRIAPRFGLDIFSPAHPPAPWRSIVFMPFEFQPQSVSAADPSAIFSRIFQSADGFKTIPEVNSTASYHDISKWRNRDDAAKEAALRLGCRWIGLGAIKLEGDEAILTVALASPYFKKPVFSTTKRGSKVLIEEIANRACLDLMAFFGSGYARYLEKRIDLIAGTSKKKAAKEALLGLDEFEEKIRHQNVNDRKALDSSAAHFEKAVALDLSYAPAHLNLLNMQAMQMLFDGKPESISSRILPQLIAIVVKRPNDLAAQEALIGVDFGVRMFDKMEERCSKFTEFDPDLTRIPIPCIEFAILCPDHESLFKTGKTAIKNFSYSSEWAFRSIVVSSLLNGNTKEAIEFADEWVRRTNALLGGGAAKISSGAYLLLGAAHFWAGDYQAAQTAIEQELALQKEPSVSRLNPFDIWTAHLGLASVMKKKGDKAGEAEQWRLMTEATKPLQAQTGACAFHSILASSSMFFEPDLSVQQIEEASKQCPESALYSQVQAVIPFLITCKLDEAKAWQEKYLVWHSARFPIHCRDNLIQFWDSLQNVQCKNKPSKNVQEK